MAEATQGAAPAAPKPPRLVRLASMGRISIGHATKAPQGTYFEVSTSDDGRTITLVQKD